MIDALVSAVVEVLFEGTGRRRLGLFGEQPHSVAMLFTGMAFWSVTGIVLCRAFHQRGIQPEQAAFPSVALMAQQRGNRPAREH
ncbi:MAG TPA: hypothetical protein VEN78_41385 [Bradyrhizobium sp.]|nr:hypothetical protein [Bradyrhizobium sp.]